MAKETTITVVDDLDGSTGASLVRFALDGKHYEIDLAEANVARLREGLAPFIKVARKAGTSRVLRSVGGNATRSTGGRAHRATADDKREFLRGAGFSVGDRGRFSVEQEQAWTAELARRAAEGATPPAEAPEAVSEALSPTQEGTRTKVGKLTAQNVAALREVGLLAPGSGNTFALIEGDPTAASERVQEAMNAAPDKKAGIYKQLIAVRNKLDKGDPKFVTVIEPGDDVAAAG